MDDSLIPVARKQELDKQVEKASRGFRYAISGVIGALILMLIIVIIQLFYLIELVRTDGAINHAKTQAYILCIAQTLTLPLAQRTQINLDSCTTTASEENVQRGNTPPTQTQTYTTPEAVQSQTSDTQPTTPPVISTAPPDPEPTTPERKGVVESTVDGLKGLLNIRIGGLDVL